MSLHPDLQLQPAGRLGSGAVGEGSLEPLVAVGGVAWGPVPYEVEEVVDELLGGGEAAHTQRKEDPTAGVGGFSGVVGELLANLTVDLVPVEGIGKIG